jgi:hypothetical protein
LIEDTCGFFVSRQPGLQPLQQRGVGPAGFFQESGPVRGGLFQGGGKQSFFSHGAALHPINATSGAGGRHAGPAFFAPSMAAYSQARA